MSGTARCGMHGMENCQPENRGCAFFPVGFVTLAHRHCHASGGRPGRFRDSGAWPLSRFWAASPFASWLSVNRRGTPLAPFHTPGAACPSCRAPLAAGKGIRTSYLSSAGARCRPARSRPSPLGWTRFESALFRVLSRAGGCGLAGLGGDGGRFLSKGKLPYTFA